MGLYQQFDEALHTEDSLHRLVEVVRSLLAQGYEREALVEEFEGFRKLLQEAGREEDEDVVLDVMDSLVGWCSPGARIEIP